MQTRVSVLSVYRRSLRLWVRYFTGLTVLALLLELPLLAFELILHVKAEITIGSGETWAANLFSLPLTLYATEAHHFLSGLLETVVGSEVHGHPRAPIRQLVRELPWVRLLLADLLFNVVVVLGLVAFLVPGIVLATWFTPVLVLINLERQPVLPTFRRSFQIVRGHFWAVFLVSTCTYVAVDLVGTTVGAAVHHVSSSSLANVLGHAIPSVVLMPIAALPVVFATFDLVAIHAARSSRADGNDGDLHRRDDGEPIRNDRAGGPDAREPVGDHDPDGDDREPATDGHAADAPGRARSRSQSGGVDGGTEPTR